MNLDYTYATGKDYFQNISKAAGSYHTSKACRKMCMISIMLNINHKFIYFNARYYACFRQILSKKFFDDPNLRELLTKNCASGRIVGRSMVATRGIACVVRN